MPKEIRFILFSRDEVQLAVASYLRERGTAARRAAAASGRAGWQRTRGSGAPAVEIGEFRSEPEAAVEVREWVDGEPSTDWLAGEELAAAIIRFCVQNKVPLPAKSSKWIQARRDALVLGLARGGGVSILMGILKGEAEAPPQAPAA
jgi:hypothetical protein